MGRLIRTTITLALGALAAVILVASPAAASYQGDGTTGPAVIIDVDCLAILARVTDLNEIVDALNDAANDAWDSWENGDLPDDGMRGAIRDGESAADQVEEAYDQASARWGSEGCKGSLPPLTGWDFPWRDLGIGG